MAEEFLWDINWDDLADESASQPSATGSPKARVAPSQTPPPNSPAAAPSPPPPQSPPKPPPLPRAIPVEAPRVQSAPPSPAVAVVEKKALIRGQRIDLATLGCGDLVLDVAVKLTASGANLCCLGLLENDRFVGDTYFVFPSQTATPCGSCRLVANGREVDLRLDLTRAPASAHRFIIAVYTDAQRGVGAHGAGTIKIRHGSAIVADGGIGASDLGAGPCALIAEIYRRGSGWRLGILLAGSGGSLESLLRSHGAEVE